MIETMYAYGYVSIFIIYIHIYKHTFSLERAWYHANEHQMVSRSHYALILKPFVNFYLLRMIHI